MVPSSLVRESKNVFSHSKIVLSFLALLSTILIYHLYVDGLTSAILIYAIYLWMV